MTVNQLSVFVENRPGGLAEFTRLLQQHGYNMRALSIADTRDFGILRVIVDDAQAVAAMLKEQGYICSVTPVVAVSLPDEPGALYRVVDLLGSHGVNIEYTYAFLSRRGNTANMVFRVGDAQKAIELLQQNGIEILTQKEIAQG